MLAFVPLSVPRIEVPEASGLLLAINRRHILLRDGKTPCNFPDLPGRSFDAPLLRVGNLGDYPCYAWELPEAPELPVPARLAETRGILDRLSRDEQHAFSRARELLFWRQHHRFCGACGAETVLSEREVAAVCRQCGALFFPQIAPAVIVAIHHGDRLLLAHNRNFKEGLYSLIAGFVEAGENLEMAVQREIREEIGIDVDEIHYFGSQSWPFPNSLMFGFSARYAGGVLRPDGVEITDAQFFRAGEFPTLPPPGSISRELIDDFLRKHPAHA